MKRIAGLVCLLTIGLTTLWAAPATAHAELLSSDPPNGQTLFAPPQRIILQFSEEVTPTKDAFKIYDAEGDEQKSSNVVHPNGDASALAVQPNELDDGAYILVYRVVSADSHPIHGAVNFRIGDASPSADEVMARNLLDSDHAPLAIRVIQGTLRGANILFTVLTIGAIAMLYAFDDKRRARAIARWSLMLLTSATVLGTFSQGAYTNALPVTKFFDVSVLNTTLDTDYGAAALLRFGATLLALTTLQTRRVEKLLIVYALIIAASFGIAGHASTGRLPLLGMALDLVHVIAGSVWLGGLAVLLALLLGKSDQKHQAIQAFSRIALICAGTILITGVSQAWRQLEGWDSLFHTDHGRLIIAKTAMFTAITTIAFFSRRAARLSREHSVRLLVGIEIIFACIVVALTTILVGTSPNRTLSSPVYDRTSTVGELRVALHVEPTRTGITSFMVTVKDANSNVVDVPEVQMSITLANEGIGPFAIDLQKTSAGRYATSSATIPKAGTWTARVVVRTTDIDQSSTSFAIPIANKETK